MGKYGRGTPHYGIPAAATKKLESQVLSIADFTDNTDATGYIDLDTKLPAGAIPIAWKAVTTKAFANADIYTPVDGTTIAFVDGGASADTITDSADGFVDAGFEAGDQVIVTGATTAGNNTTYTLVNVAAGTLTLATGTITTAEAGIEGISFAGTGATAAISVGIAGDLDKYSADTARSVAAIGTVGSSVLAADALDDMGTAQTIRVTITETADFGEYSAGEIVVSIFYVD